MADPYAVVAFGPTRTRTMRALVRAGMATQQPEQWTITPAGRAALGGAS